jgi:2-polyprenyl-6-methoxyphenol hydroxylase-like FAD-dependent oxidoreductase
MSTTAHHDYDVIVVGARVAGASTAMLLARQGHRVLVVDRVAPTTPTLSTHALMKAGVLQLRRWGVLDELIAVGTPAVPETVIHLGDDAIVIPYKPVAGTDSWYAPRRTVLDPVLVDAARCAGAEMRFGLTMTDVLTDRSGTVVGIVATRADGTPFTATARLVIGADGARSRVARSVGAPSYRLGRHRGAFVYAYFTDLGMPGYHWFYRPGATAGCIPTNGGTLVFAGCPSTRFESNVRADVEAGFWALLTEAAPEVADQVRDAERTSRWRSSAGLTGYLRRSAGRGWALVGDAAHFKDPLSAHGITDALRDAELLARAAHDGLTGARPAIDALAAYQHQRDDLTIGLFETVDRIASYEWDAAEISALLLAMSDEMGREVEALLALDPDWDAPTHNGGLVTVDR